MFRFSISLVFLILAITLNSGLYAQNQNTLAYEVFDKNYKTTSYKRFMGEISENGNYIRYNDKVLIIPDLPEEQRMIFTSGLFHANVITGDAPAVIKSHEDIAKMTNEETVMYNITRNDSIYIGGYFQELKSLNPNPKTKRFVFWLWHKNCINPTECYFEFQNKRATPETTMQDFVAGAILTFFYRGSIIL